MNTEDAFSSPMAADLVATALRVCAGLVAMATCFAPIAQAGGNPYKRTASASPVMAYHGVEDPFEWATEPTQVAAGQETDLVLHLKIPDGYEIVRDQIAIVAIDTAGLFVGTPEIPEGVRRVDPQHERRDRVVFEQDVQINLPVYAPEHLSGLMRLTLEVRHQGCRGRLCYPVVTQVHESLVRVVDDSGDQ